MLVRLCVRVSHVSTCELVSSQGHLVIPQAYQGQRTHKYQRQMPHTHSKNNCVSSGCRCHSSLSLPLCLSCCVCMYGIFNFIIGTQATHLPLRIAAHRSSSRAPSIVLACSSFSSCSSSPSWPAHCASGRRIAEHLWRRQRAMACIPNAQ